MFRLCILAAMILGIGSAQKRPVPQFAFLDGLPADYQVDLRLQALEARAVKDPGEAEEMLRAVWETAPRLAAPFLVAYTGDTRGDVRERQTAWAARRRLDELSVRLRVVKLLLPRRPAEALALFEQIPSPRPPLASCAQTLAPELGEYYATASAIFNQAFTASQISKGEHFNFLRRLAAGVFHWRAAGPLMKHLDLLNLPAALRQELASSLGVRMPMLAGAPRDFLLANTSDHLAGQIESWATRPLTAAVLVDGYRRGLEMQLHGSVCASDVDEWTSLVRDYNQKMRPFSSQPSYVEWDPRRAKLIHAAPPPLLPETTPFEGVLRGLLVKVSGPRLLGKHAEGVDPEAWELGASTFLAKLADWKPYANPDAQQSAAVFLRKDMFYHYLITLLPDGPLLHRAVDRYASLLENDALQKESPMEWLVPVQRLIRMTRSPDAETKQEIADLQKQGKDLTMILPKDNPAAIQERLARSPNPVIAAYVRFEKISPVRFRLFE
ncbi:MAG: hypothetical protein K2X35_00455 [Bryobacteraceae bacterium]|nr:hypothetical protein [Bryobacteraceae bacterium]